MNFYTIFISVAVVHADNDAATKARLEIEFENIVKKDDQNHLHKGITSSLHHLEKRYCIQ